MLLKEAAYPSPEEQEEQQRSLRHGKRYPVVNCPLLAVKWWRVVYDEAQRVIVRSLRRFLRP